MNTGDYPWVLQELDRHIENILALKDLADSYDARFVLFSTRLAGNGLMEAFWSKLDAEVPHFLGVSEEIIRAAGDRPVGWPYNSYWNFMGNRLAADVMYHYLLESGTL